MAIMNEEEKYKGTQCLKCQYAWHNCQSSQVYGWCYMFKYYVPSCQKHNRSTFKLNPLITKYIYNFTFKKTNKNNYLKI